MSEYDIIKLVSVFLYPLGSVLLLSALGGVFCMLRRPRTGRALILSALAWLWICSMPATSSALQGALEQPYLYKGLQDVPDADLIVILGGGGIERYCHGARLYHAGRGHTVLLSGARDPRLAPGPSEAERGAAFMTELGVPANDQILDDASQTTKDHVHHVSRVLDASDMDTFLLVTSATHMRRAEAVFRAGGLEPIPVAIDFTPRRNEFSVWHFVPDVNSLSGTTRAIHEYLGYWFYLALDII